MEKYFHLFHGFGEEGIVPFLEEVFLDQLYICYKISVIEDKQKYTFIRQSTYFLTYFYVIYSNGNVNVMGMKLYDTCVIIKVFTLYSFETFDKNWKTISTRAVHQRQYLIVIGFVLRIL